MTTQTPALPGTPGIDALGGSRMLKNRIATVLVYAAFGFQVPSLHAAIALFTLCGGAFVFWLAPLGAALSRRHEYQADRYAVRLARAPEALSEALVRLNRENLSNPDPHPWYGAWHHSHPTLAERLAAIRAASAAGAPG